MLPTLVVSWHGQITMPVETHERFGIKPDDVVVLKDRGSQIVRKPGTAGEVQHYIDDQIAQRHAEHGLKDYERARILDASTVLK